MKRLAYIFSVAGISVLVLAGCGNSDNKIVGTWEMSKMEDLENGSEISKSALESQIGTKYDLNLDFNKDKTMSVEMSGISKSGTYSVEGNSIKVDGITFDSSETYGMTELKIEDDYIVWKMQSDIDVYFEKYD